MRALGVSFGACHFPHDVRLIEIAEKVKRFACRFTSHSAATSPRRRTRPSSPRSPRRLPRRSTRPAARCGFGQVMVAAQIVLSGVQPVIQPEPRPNVCRFILPSNLRLRTVIGRWLLPRVQPLPLARLVPVRAVAAWANTRPPRFVRPPLMAASEALWCFHIFSERIDAPPRLASSPDDNTLARI